MSRNIYLTDKEIRALTDTCSEWSQIMGDGDEPELVDERLNEGLGSALRKLYKGTNAERVYTNYQSNRRFNHGSKITKNNK